MEFTNEIFFNKPLAVDSTVIITYSGKLYREHSKDVSIVYGYDDNWDETDTVQMVETDNGFEATLTIKNYTKFNFCFSNSFNIWDNNDGNNYIASIESKEKVTEETIEEAIVEETTEAESLEKAELDQSADIEAAFASLLDSILDDTNNNNETIDISNLSGFGLQSVDEIKEEDMVNCDSIFAELFEELTEENSASDEDESELERVELQQAEVTNYDNYDAKELDNLMDNLLTSISDNNETAEYATPVQEIENTESNVENAGLPAVQEQGDWVDKLISLSSNFGKKIVAAFKKLGKLIGLNSSENVNSENK